MCVRAYSCAFLCAYLRALLRVCLCIFVSMCACVCVHIRVHIGVHIRVHFVCVYWCACVHVCACIFVCKFACMFVCIVACVLVHICEYVCMCVHMCVMGECACDYIHICATHLLEKCSPSLGCLPVETRHTQPTYSFASARLRDLTLGNFGTGFFVVLDLISMFARPMMDVPPLRRLRWLILNFRSRKIKMQWPRGYYLLARYIISYS